MTSAPVPTLNSDGYGAFRVIGKKFQGSGWMRKLNIEYVFLCFSNNDYQEKHWVLILVG